MAAAANVARAGLFAPPQSWQDRRARIGVLGIIGTIMSLGSFLAAMSTASLGPITLIGVVVVAFSLRVAIGLLRDRKGPKVIAVITFVLLVVASVGQLGVVLYRFASASAWSADMTSLLANAVLSATLFIWLSVAALRALRAGDGPFEAISP